MAIIFQYDKRSPDAQGAGAGPTAASSTGAVSVADERQPLLASSSRYRDEEREAPPPSYTPPPASPTPSTELPKPAVSPSRSAGSPGSRGRLSLLKGAACVLLAVVALFGLGWLFGGRPWSNDPSGWDLPRSGSSTTSSPPPFSSPSHPPSSSPGFRLSRTVSLSLPLSTSSPALFLHSFGSFVQGETILTQDDKAGGGKVGVTVRVDYKDESAFKDRVRVWAVEDERGRVGLDLITPSCTSAFCPSSPFRFTVHFTLPASMSTSSKDGLWMESFEGAVNNMVLHTTDLSPRVRFRELTWRSTNAPVLLGSLSADVLDLGTTNGCILFAPSTSSSSSSSTERRLNATVLTLRTTNAPIDLSASPVRAASSASLHSTSGKILVGGGGSSADADAGLVAPAIKIRTSNGPIEGTFSAGSIDVQTTNGHIAAHFRNVSSSLVAHTTNGYLTSTISFWSSLSPYQPKISVSLKTTSSHLTASYLLPSNSISSSSPSSSSSFSFDRRLSLSHSTSNAPLTLALPGYTGRFSLTTSSYSRTRLTIPDGDEAGGRRIEGLDAPRGQISGWVVGRGGEGGQRDMEANEVKGSTSNGDAVVNF